VQDNTFKSRDKIWLGIWKVGSNNCKGS